MTSHQDSLQFADTPASREAVEAAIEQARERKAGTWEDVVKTGWQRIPQWDATVCKERAPEHP